MANVKRTTYCMVRFQAFQNPFSKNPNTIRFSCTKLLRSGIITRPRKDGILPYMATPAPPGFPALNPFGTLPPFVGADATAIAGMSPYLCTLTDMARVFCTSAARVTIFKGLLSYRRELSRLGIVNGFQWLSGSFVEAIERIENRDPRDIDLVTFCTRPASCPTPTHFQALALANPDIFQPARAKLRFFCDAYFVNFEFGPRSVVLLTRYWFGLYSHRRDWLWKGLLELPLVLSQDDTDAENFVDGLNF
jgi:hypothetical protein